MAGALLRGRRWLREDPFPPMSQRDRGQQPAQSAKLGAYGPLEWVLPTPPPFPSLQRKRTLAAPSPSKCPAFPSPRLTVQCPHPLASQGSLAQPQQQERAAGLTGSCQAVPAPTCASSS